MKSEKLVIKKMGINGEGIGYIDQKIAFIKGALTGEEVLADIDVRERRYLSGHVVKVLKKSSMRVPHHNNDKKTYGYSLFHMNYLDQLPFKKGLIKDAIAKYTKFDVNDLDVKPVLASDDVEHYRHYAAFPIVYSRGKLVFGELEGVDHFLSVDDLYRLQSPVINTTLNKIQKILNDHKCKDYYPRVKCGLRYIMVRQFNEGLQVVFITGKDGIAKEVTKEIAAIDEVASIYYSINTSSHSDFNEKGFKRIYGMNTMTSTFKDQDYKINVKSHMIINPEMEYKKYDVLTSLVDEEDDILSLYSGLGLWEMSLPNSVTALEENEYQLDDALKNRDRIKEMNKFFKLCNIDKEIVRLCKKKTYDKVIVHGADITEDIAKSIILSKVPAVILEGKNMSALGLSIEKLQNRYHITYVSGVDVDPNTPLVHAIVKLERNER